jgi:hypothetical protein
VFNSAFIKRAAITVLCIEWYVLFLGYTHHCEAMPEFGKPVFVDPRKVAQVGSDCRLMSPVGGLIHYESAIIGFLHECVQFGFKSTDEYFILLSFFAPFVPCIGEKMVKIYRYL